MTDLLWIVGFPLYLTLGTLAALYIPHWLTTDRSSPR